MALLTAPPLSRQCTGALLICHPFVRRLGERATRPYRLSAGPSSPSPHAITRSGLQRTLVSDMTTHKRRCTPNRDRCAVNGGTLPVPPINHPRWHPAGAAYKPSAANSHDAHMGLQVRVKRRRGNPRMCFKTGNWRLELSSLTTTKRRAVRSGRPCVPFWQHTWRLPLTACNDSMSRTLGRASAHYDGPP
jgi:hypothetical protein